MTRQSVPAPAPHGHEHHAEHRGQRPVAGPGDHHPHHTHAVADFRRRFWVSLVLTAPVLVLAPVIQRWIGLEARLAFPGDRFVEFAFASVVFVYGGGWHTGSRKSVTPVGKQLQSLGYGCALVSHRLSPAHKFPAQAEDVAAAFAWVKKNIAAKGGDGKVQQVIIDVKAK